MLTFAAVFDFFLLLFPFSLVFFLTVHTLVHCSSCRTSTRTWWFFFSTQTLSHLRNAPCFYGASRSIKIFTLASWTLQISLPDCKIFSECLCFFSKSSARPSRKSCYRFTEIGLFNASSCPRNVHQFSLLFYTSFLCILFSFTRMASQIWKKKSRLFLEFLV